MVLAAGHGRRLAPLTDRVPKPLVTVAGEALLDRMLRGLAAAGVTDVVCNLHHLGDRIRAHAGDGHAHGLRIRYSEEPELLETGGGLRAALPWLSPDGRSRFLVVNADVWTDYPLARLVGPPTSPQERAHLVLVPRPHDAGSGDFSLDPQTGRPVAVDPRPWTFSGLSRLHPELFAEAPDGPFRLPELWGPMLGSPAITAETHSGRWFDVGTPERLARTRRALGDPTPPDRP